MRSVTQLYVISVVLYIFAVIGGLALLVYGADRFVYGAAGTADALGVSPLIIGLTVVGFGTSAPEILVSGTAALQGNPGLGFGNAIGSNITNIALVVGVTALVMPLKVDSQTLKREFPALLFVSLAVFFLVLDGHISRADSSLLLVGMVAILLLLAFIAGHRRPDDPLAGEFDGEIPHGVSIRNGLVWLFVGLLLLLVSARVLVWGAVGIARIFGVSDLIIGLTIVAIGTSLPELAASIMSAIRREHDLIIGNIIGSNMFNLLAVIGIAGLIHPGTFPADALTRDMPIMLALTVVLFLMAFGMRGAARIGRLEGALLLGSFVAYEAMLYAVSVGAQ